MTIGGNLRRNRPSNETAPAPALKQPAAKSRQSKPSNALFGSDPRVSLLPLELQSTHSGRGLRRRLTGGVVACVIVAVLGVGGSAVYAMSQAASVTDATATNASLTQQLLKFAPVQKLVGEQKLATAAARVGSSTAIDWPTVLQQLESGMPAGFTVTQVAVDSASPIVDYTQGSSALEKQRVATVTLTTTANSIANLPSWLSALQKVKGYADDTWTVSPGNTGGHTVTVTVHMTDAVYITPLHKESTR